LNLGKLFVLSPYTGGADYQELKWFALATGANPNSALIEGSNHILYGTTDGGGSKSEGTVFQISLDGSEYKVLKSFLGTLEEGGMPQSLMEGAGGILYGTTRSFGGPHRGTVFRMNPDGSGFSVLKIFTTTEGDGAIPALGGALLRGSDEKLYGTTLHGGDNIVQGSFVGEGTVFRLNVDGSGFEVITTFRSTGGDGASPQGQLTRASNGMLHGTTQSGGSANLGTVFQMNSDGTRYTVLKSFTGKDGDGATPLAGVVLGTNGALYGTTSGGGGRGAGTLFEIYPDGNHYAVLKSFTFSDGASPSTPLMQGSSGMLFGTARFGGTGGQGVIFKLNNDGTGYAVIKSFSGIAGDGASPWSSLIEGDNGELYGTTFTGGNNNLGIVFKLNQDGSGYAVLKSFSGTNGDGANPRSGLAPGNDGALYGTTTRGGDSNLGTVFRLSPDGSNYERLKSFSGTGGDGANPFAPLLQVDANSFYGTTINGGSGGKGIVFKLDSDGNGYTVIKTFTGTDGDGVGPRTGLVQASDGRLVGTTSFGGEMNYGIVFALVPELPNVVLRISPLFLLSADDTNHLIIAGSKIGARVIFDGSLTTSTEPTPLYYAWFLDGETNDIATSVIATNLLNVGSHTVYLEVTSGHAKARSSLEVQVITPEMAVDDLIHLIATSLSYSDSKPLVDSLAPVRESFSRDGAKTAVNQLNAFRNKVRAQIAPWNPTLADEFAFVTEEIILSTR